MRVIHTPCRRHISDPARVEVRVVVVGCVFERILDERFEMSSGRAEDERFASDMVELTREYG